MGKNTGNFWKTNHRRDGTKSKFYDDDDMAYVVSVVDNPHQFYENADYLIVVDPSTHKEIRRYWRYQLEFLAITRRAIDGEAAWSVRPKTA